MTEKRLNSSIKQTLGVSPYTLLFGDAILTEQSLIAEIDRIPTATFPRTIRDHVHKLMDRQSCLIVAAVKSQQQINADNLQKRYSTYPRAPKVRRKRERSRNKPTRAHSIGAKSNMSSTVPQKWANDQQFMGPLNKGNRDLSVPISYYNVLNLRQFTIVDTIDQIYLNPYILTKYQVDDYVLRDDL